MISVTRQRSACPGAVAVVLSAVLLAVASAWAAPKNGADPKARAAASEQFFSARTVPHLKIEITGTNLTQLQRDNRKYVRATVREGETVYTDVAIHLKGAAGSFRGLDDRPALTLNFKRFEEDQWFHGLDKIHLNNSVQDPSYMTEILCGDMFLAAGVPTARGAHARVTLNGRDLGLYVLKEGYDKEFLRRHFKSAKGNLYDGGFLREITEPLQKNSGDDVKDYADLKAVAAAANEPDPAKRLERLAKVLDLDRFISFIALEVMTWDWDGYAMKRNNYRLYHDPATDKVVFIPHGMDQMFWDPNGPILPNFEGLVAQAVVSTAEGRQRYRERMSLLLTNVFKVDALTNRMNELQARIRPVLASISAEAARNHDGAVANLRHQILQRALNLQKQLNVPSPKQVRFPADGLALGGKEWQAQNDGGAAVLDKVTDGEKRPTLHIRAGGGGACLASWRTRVLLDVGQYRLEGAVRSAGVAPVKDQKGEGAGVRISGSQQPRPNAVSGNAPWTKVAYEFSVPSATEETELVCELRATKGEVWFDLGSLKLVRVGR